jgi:hypothetical protein
MHDLAKDTVTNPSSENLWRYHEQGQIIMYGHCGNGHVAQAQVRPRDGRPGDLLKLVIGKTMLIVLVGLALGGGAALTLTRVLASSLYDTSPTDRVTWVAAGVLLAAVALVACYFPARGVTKVDPMTILHFE